MNNELEWEKVLEWEQGQNTYLLHVVTNQQQIHIEVQDKYSGQIWKGIYSNVKIEEFTAKAKFPKKFSVFIRMLISSLLRTSESLRVEILSYRQINNKCAKPGYQSKVITPEQLSKRFFLLTYNGQFQKEQFPLPLLQFTDITSDRLMFTINRMANELKLLREGQSQSEMAKENVLLKYENESLKNKLKSSSKIDASSLLQPKLEELQTEIDQKNLKINFLEQEAALAQNKLKESEKMLAQSRDKVEELEDTIKELQSSQSQRGKSQKNIDYYQQKIEELIVQMNDLSAELTYSRQKQTKYELKVQTLQKQLQKMISNKRTAVNNIKNSKSQVKENSSDDKRSEKSLSVKSGRSNTSQKSLGKTRNINRKTYNTFGQVQSNLNTSNSKKQPSKRKSSLYDSDTESSRMRKMATGRNSPYRQTNNASKKNTQRPTNQRSRSKSKQRMSSPKPSLAIESQMMTEGYHSDSSDDEQLDRIEGYLKDLKQRKGVRNAKGAVQNSGKKIQNRLQTLEELIRKTALSTRTKN